MNTLIITALILAFLGIAYQTGSSRSRALAGTSGRRLHSRPSYHGSAIAIWTLVPLLLVLGAWALLDSYVIRTFITWYLPESLVAEGGNALRASIARVEALATGYGVVGEVQEFERTAAQAVGRFQTTAFLIVVAAATTLAALGLFYARKRITPQFRARNEVEGAVRILLLACSVVAILTTFGIVASLLTEAMRFFSFVNPLDFFFGTVWNPRFSTTGAGGGGEYGLIPLLWGTIQITIIAILTAVPIGLMAAVYLSQYAKPRVRSVVKPLIEVLAGIPTIVYGFFALVTVGPFLASFGDAIGVDIRATSALTAGIVMGVMIIPFISSLSDDIIRQVPTAMRDGSLGLGATKSETIRRVILPAALPGIVGAILLAVSRAIGETMIVVLAAGNSPVLRFNPFEPTSTITVSIVNQLTGDSDFAGPQSLVAFALGLTLFVLTLVLNVGALYIVRRFREQYD